MKSKIVFVLLLLLALLVVSTRSNSYIQDKLIDIVSPIKRYYNTLTRSVKDRGESYIFQKEHIQKLIKENKKLRKYLLDQSRYIKQLSTLFEKIPTLEKLPHRNIEIVDTVSYVKLNSFNEVLLERPEKSKLDEGRIYGLIQNDVVGGTAILKGDHLYGYLDSSPKCKFSVFIGDSRAPGIAQGVDRKTMVVKFIPKWSKIKVDDKVETSGLDGIFFAGIPVGRVKEVKIENSYKTAYISIYSDTLHPDYYFLIEDTRPYLVRSYDKNETFFESNETLFQEHNPPKEEKKISSIPETIQTQESTVNPEDFEIPKENIVTKTPKPPFVFLHPKKKKRNTASQSGRKNTKPKTPANQVKPFENVQQEPAVQTPAPSAPKKRKSAMDFLNGR